MVTTRCLLVYLSCFVAVSGEPIIILVESCQPVKSSHVRATVHCSLPLIVDLMIPSIYYSFLGQFVQIPKFRKCEGKYRICIVAQ